MPKPDRSKPIFQIVPLFPVSLPNGQCVLISQSEVEMLRVARSAYEHPWIALLSLGITLPIVRWAEEQDRKERKARQHKALKKPRAKTKAAKRR
jgi:hypothetical protein